MLELHEMLGQRILFEADMLRIVPAENALLSSLVCKQGFQSGFGGFGQTREKIIRKRPFS